MIVPIIFTSICILIAFTCIYNIVTIGKDTPIQKLKIRRELNRFSDGLEGKFQKEVIEDIMKLGKEGWEGNGSRIEKENFQIMITNTKNNFYYESYNYTIYRIYYKDDFLFSTTNLNFSDFINSIIDYNVYNTLLVKYQTQRTKDTKEVFEDLEKIQKHTKQIEEIRNKYDKKHIKLYK